MKVRERVRKNHQRASINKPAFFLRLHPARNDIHTPVRLQGDVVRLMS